MLGVCDGEDHRHEDEGGDQFGDEGGSGRIAGYRITAVCADNGRRSAGVAAPWDLRDFDPVPITRCVDAAALEKPSKTRPLRSGEVEAIGIHHLGPRGDEILHEFLLRVVRAIDFRECAEL